MMLMWFVGTVTRCGWAMSPPGSQRQCCTVPSAGERGPGTRPAPWHRPGDPQPHIAIPVPRPLCSSSPVLSSCHQHPSFPPQPWCPSCPLVPSWCQDPGAPPAPLPILSHGTIPMPQYPSCPISPSQCPSSPRTHPSACPALHCHHSANTPMPPSPVSHPPSPAPIPNPARGALEDLWGGH